MLKSQKSLNTSLVSLEHLRGNEQRITQTETLRRSKRIGALLLPQYVESAD